MEATELISRCKAGERQALNLLYQQYKPQLLNICRQYAKGDDVAEDLLHDAFVVIFTSLDRLENDERLGCTPLSGMWAITIASMLTKNWLHSNNWPKRNQILLKQVILQTTTN